MVSFCFSFTLMGGCPCLWLWFCFSLINLLFWGVVPRFCFWLIIRTFGGLSLSFACVCIHALGCHPFSGRGGCVGTTVLLFFLCPFLLFVDDVDRGTSSCI